MIFLQYIFDRYNSKIRMKVQGKLSQSSIEITPFDDKIAKITIPQELVGSCFLKTIWETYFSNRLDIPSEDRVDHFNKILAFIKVQTKGAGTQITNGQLNQLRAQNDRITSQLEKSKLKQREYLAIIENKQTMMEKLEKLNENLKATLAESKHQKNRCEERIIELSSNIYDLERGLPLNMSIEYSHQEVNNTLDQYSAISLDRYDERQKSKGPLFSKRQSFAFEISRALNESCVHSEQNNDINEQDDTYDFNLKFPRRNNHPLKQSLQIFDRETTPYSQNHMQFIQDMKKMKLQTERIMKIQNDRQTLREDKRRTLGAFAQRPTPVVKQIQKETRRFKRIRA